MPDGHGRPCAAGFYRHSHVATLLQAAGVSTPPVVPGTFPQPYPDLGHAVDWEEAKRVSAFVADEVVEAMLCVGSGAEVADKAQALTDLDIDAIWWRDEATYTRPDALLQGLEKTVLPRLR